MGSFFRGSDNHASWYTGIGWFVRDDFPWFACGGKALVGSVGGLFTFNHYHNGSNRVDTSFRLVLTPLLQ